MRTIDAPSALCELATVINKGDFNIGFDKSPRDYCDIAIRVPLKSGEYLFVEVEPTVEKNNQENSPIYCKIY